MIELDGVHKRLGGLDVLRGVDLTVEQGETMVIIGRSGSGKSVTLKHMIGLMVPDRGTVRVDGSEWAGLGKGGTFELRRRFGVLFQSGALLNWMTVYDNVALPLREHTDLSDEQIAETVREKLALVDLVDHADKTPSDISGGMKKRAGLARAIVMDPEILLYDEPTSGLDPVLSSTINELINNVKHELGVTSVVVTHDMSSAYAIADRIAMLYEGAVIQVGTPDEIRGSDNPVVHQFVKGLTEGPIT
jgi:phospholipid/cholesterol/gamma-HCH transport system ATP-binding protein